MELIAGGRYWRSSHVPWLVLGVIFALASVLWNIVPHDLDGVLGRASKLLSAPDHFSEKLIFDSLKRYADIGDADLGGFMLAFEKNVHIAAVKIIDGPDIERDFYPYISNFSIQYDAFKLLTFGSPACVGFAYWAAKVICATGMGLVVFGIAYWAAREFSVTAGLTGAAAFTLSPMLLERAISVYWVIFLFFLPALSTMYLYKRLRSARGFPFLLLIVGLLVLLKSLTGYEYLSAIVLSAAVPLVYYELKGAEGRISRAWRMIVGRVFLLGVASLIGFALAAALHCLKAASFFGSIEKGVNAFVLPLSYSTLESQTGIRGDFNLGLLPILKSYVLTFAFHNLFINLCVLGALCFGMARMYLTVPRGTFLWNLYRPSLVPIWGGLAVSVVSTVSWELLVLKHSIIHHHINWITMYLFFVPFGLIVATELCRFKPEGGVISTEPPVNLALSERPA